VMAGVLMGPRAYTVSYAYDRAGEDVGWSLAAKAAGIDLWWCAAARAKQCDEARGSVQYRPSGGLVGGVSELSVSCSPDRIPRLQPPPCVMARFSWFTSPLYFLAIVVADGLPVAPDSNAGRTCVALGLLLHLYRQPNARLEPPGEHQLCHQ
jgi:hypothetical protein